MATKEDIIRIELIRFINEVNPVLLDFDEDAQMLNQKYLEKEFKNNKSKGIYNDSSHVAIATVNNIHHIISFNCHHLVNDRRIDGFNSVNIQNGFDVLIDITTPDRFILPDLLGD